MKIEQAKMNLQAMMKADKANEEKYKQAMMKLEISDDARELIEMGLIDEDEIVAGAVRELKSVHQTNKMKAYVKKLDINVVNTYESEELTENEKQQRANRLKEAESEKAWNELDIDDLF